MPTTKILGDRERDRNYKMLHSLLDLLVHMETTTEMLMNLTTQQKMYKREINQHPYIFLVYNILNFVLIRFLKVADYVFLV